jgi:hypothetical protein
LRIVVSPIRLLLRARPRYKSRVESNGIRNRPGLVKGL